MCSEQCQAGEKQLCMPIKKQQQLNWNIMSVNFNVNAQISLIILSNVLLS